MTLKEIQSIWEALHTLQDFAHSNCDGDESGIYDEMMVKYEKATDAITKERQKLQIRNVRARAKRIVKRQ